MGVNRETVEKGIYKIGDVYYITIYPKGGQKWVRVGTSIKRARKLKAEMRTDIYRGEYQELKRIRFDEFASKWLENKRASRRVKSSTLESYELIVRKHLEPYFKDTKLTHIEEDRVQGYVSAKMEEGKLSPKTINNTLVVLKEMFKHAKRWGYLAKNPAEDVEKPRVEHKEMDFLTPDEIRKFLKEVNQPYYPLFFTAVFTGMRRGELLALKWGDIDWNSSKIIVRRRIYRGRFDDPKSEASKRSIVMSPTLVSVLKKQKLASPLSELDLVFCSSQGKPLDPDNLVKRQFLPALRRAKLRMIRFHDLRHTYTALLIAQGENIKFIQSQLGHASISTTLDRYGHLIPETYSGVGERLDETVFSKVFSKVESLKQTEIDQNGMNLECLTSQVNLAKLK